MFLVLLGASLHATWNVIIKAGSDKQLDTMLVICGGAIIAAFALPFIPLPVKASWPYLGASVVIHFFYFTLVALAYRTGDMSYAYPIMRGSAPSYGDRSRIDGAGILVFRRLDGHHPDLRRYPCSHRGVLAFGSISSRLHRICAAERSRNNGLYPC